MIIRFCIAAALAVLLLCCTVASADNERLGKWLDGLRAEALRKGIPSSLLDETLGSFQPLPRVLELERKQPEFRMTFEAYLKLVAPEERVKEGRIRFTEDRVLLSEIASRYGVAPEFIVALWAAESDFGRKQGKFPVIDALATLAFEGRRPAFFRKELLAALSILASGDISFDRMTGSWAGAMGQCQFMPSSYLRRAVDYNRDGRRDIWETREDVFGSIANYLSRAGWLSGERWGQEVQIPERFDPRFLSGKRKMTVRQWEALKVKPLDGDRFPAPSTKGILVRPDRKSGRVFMVYHNWQVLMKWNRSPHFATAVGLLADGVAHRDPQHRKMVLPGNEPAVSDEMWYNDQNTREKGPP